MAAEEPPVSPGLLEALASGTFGEVIDALQQIFGDKIDKYVCPLPRVVVIGSESVGKSSLLENITKQKLFPAGEGQQTRCPIVLNLFPSSDGKGPKYAVRKAGNLAGPATTDAAEALKQIREKMPPVGHIHPEPVEVNITVNKLTRLALIDVPGLRAQGPMRESSSALIESFVKDPNTLIICVCEATTPAVVCSCLELINRHDRRKNTLMVFTKADGMALPGQWSKLCKKLLGSEQGHPAEEGLEGMDCMAVISQDDCQASQSVERHEAAIFDKQLQGLGYSKNDLARIKDRCGIDKLVARLHTRFRQLVKHEWTHNSIDSLEQQQRETLTQLHGLGTKPQLLDLEQVLAYAADQSPLQQVQIAISQLANRGYQHAIRDCRLTVENKEGPWSDFNRLWTSKQASIFYDLQSDAIRQGRMAAWSSNWATEWAAVLHAAQQDIQYAFSRPANPDRVATTLSIWRFEGVQQALSASSAPILNEQALGELRRRLPDIISSLTKQQWHSSQNDWSLLSQDELKCLAKAVTRSFHQVLSEEAVILLHKHIKAPAQLKLVECSAVASQRAELEELIKKLQAAKAAVDKVKLS